MKTMFRSQELWDLVEHGYKEPDLAPVEPNQQLKENHKKDAKALMLIQSPLEDDIFSRISTADTSKQAVSGIVNLMRSYVEVLSNEIFVSKVLRSLTSKFDNVVAAIEETKDFSTYTFDELKSSLIAHEARLNKSHENSEEKAFQVKEESSKCRHDFHGRSRGYGRGMYTKPMRMPW
ncbi:hypothetical protein PVK06_017183 [Gossypium arboreum]|uniref:UBN2 domain-containing protein n=1 Tax=Gossypium arboreum TaxID=29729 RepID=A0ABR0Q2Y5_GOSAR|nr:hypothetical protein PVK06_017183 [Gossypium arboreum]